MNFDVSRILSLQYFGGGAVSRKSFFRMRCFNGYVFLIFLVHQLSKYVSRKSFFQNEVFQWLCFLFSSTSIFKMSLLMFVGSYFCKIFGGGEVHV